MAEILEDYEWDKHYLGRPSRYPWTEWMDGQTRVLKDGEDFVCKPSSLVAYLREKATKADMKVHISHPDDDNLIIQFYTEEVNV